MKKSRTFLKFILIVSAVMFGLTILLLYFSAKRAENDGHIKRPVEDLMINSITIDKFKADEK